MEKNFTRQIREIIDGLQIPEGFTCLNCECEKNISLTKKIANEFYTCIGEQPWNCPHSFSFGYSHFCFCPLFTYVAEELFKRRNTVESGPVPEERAGSVAD